MKRPSKKSKTARKKNPFETMGGEKSWNERTPFEKVTIASQNSASKIVRIFKISESTVSDDDLAQLAIEMLIRRMGKDLAILADKSDNYIRKTAKNAVRESLRTILDREKANGVAELRNIDVRNVYTNSKPKSPDDVAEHNEEWQVLAGTMLELKGLELEVTELTAVHGFSVAEIAKELKETKAEVERALAGVTFKVRRLQELMNQDAENTSRTTKKKQLA